MTTATHISLHTAAAAHAPRLHGLPGIGLATFLGTPLAGGLVIADNFRRLGNRGAAVASVGLGVLGGAMVLAVGFALGDRLPGPVGTLIALGFALGAKKLGDRLFGTELAAAEAEERPPITAWAGAGIGLACAALFVAMLLL